MRTSDSGTGPDDTRSGGPGGPAPAGGGSVARLAWVDEVCDRYDALWRAGAAPAVGAFLRAEGVDPVTAPADLLRELARVEAEYRRAAGHTPAPDPAATGNLSRSVGGAGPGEAPDGVPDVPGYDITGEIAEGGMGAVYAAWDRSLGREVAVKTVLPELAGDPRYAAQFEREARLAARLPHPGIPPVHALGTTADGRPFLAMKLVRGDTLAARLSARPGPAAGLPALVAAFEGVCQAVGYAHSQGVVHRDLKPHNVMVGSFGEVQVMDWGLAKDVRGAGGGAAGEADGGAGETDSPAHSGGLKGGTPAYIAPEQARGESVDARADVFALGAVLCEILTGGPPYPGKLAGKVLKRAAGDVADALARLDRCGADAELVGLCRRCLSADPADRPADGRVVAGEVAAYRAGVEERARRAEADRAAAEARAAGEAATRREAEGRAAAEADARRAAEAEAREQRKRRRVQLALAAAVGLLLAAGGWFAWRDQKRDADQARVEGDKARTEAERVAAEALAREEQQKVAGRVAAGRAAFGVLLGEAEDALRRDRADQARAALAEAARRVAEGGLDDFRPRLDRADRELALLRTLDAIDDSRWTVVGGKPPPHGFAVPRWREAFAGYGVAPGTTHPGEAAGRVNGSLVRGRLLTALEVWFVATRDAEVRAVLSAADPDEFRDAARTTDYSRAVLVWAFRGRAPGPQPVWFAVAHGAEKLLDRGSRDALLRDAHQVRPDSFPLLMELGTEDATNNKESAGRRAGWYRAAVAVRSGNVVAWSNLGGALHAAGDVRGAVAACQEAIKHDPKYALAHNNLGVALRDLGDVRGAVAAFREAVRLDPKLAVVHLNLGLVLHASGDVRGAVAASREAVRLDPKLAMAHDSLGAALFASGDVRGAVAASREAVRLDPTDAAAHRNLGAVLGAAGDVPGAVAASREAVRLDPKDAGAQSNLGNALGAAGDVPGAVAAWREAARLDPKFAMAHYNLGVSYLQQKEYAEAVASARAAIAADPKWSNAHALLGLALQGTGDIPGARAALTEAARLDPKQFGPLLKQLPPVPVAPPPRPAGR
ncbi:MAG: hypothetical protein C0501_29090 [Isosphaera sp.]|nr:hypothetical protein [Isosphaera sp.]